MSDDNLRDLLRATPSLAEALDDVHVRFVTIAPNGEWSFEKLGRHRTGETAIDGEVLESLQEKVGDGALTGGWSLQSFDGTNGKTIFVERRPVAVVDRVPDEVLQTLKARVRRDGVIVIAGPPGSGKSNMLLWATRHLANEHVLLVSEVPPAESPGSNVTHLRPPVTTAEHRSMQRLVRRSPNVSWDRLSGLEDVNTLLGGAYARRRVFTLDSTDTLSTLRRVQAWRDMGYEANLDVILQLTSSVIGRAEVLDLLVFEDGQWTEAYASSGSRLKDVEALGRGRSRKHAITQPGIEPDAPTGEQKTPEANTRPQTPPEGRAAALRAGIRKRPGQPTQDFDGPMTIEVPEEDDPITSRLEGDSEALLEGFVEEDTTSSGEIDLQGFLAKRDSEAHDDGAMLPEDTRQYQVQVAGESPVRPDRDEASEPDEIIPGVDLNAPQDENYNLENLKITRVEDVEEEKMENLREMRRQSLAKQDAEADLQPPDLDDVPSVEIGEEDLILAGDGEWEEDEHGESMTAVANPDVYEAAAKEVTGDGETFDDDDETNDGERPALTLEGDHGPDSVTNPSIVIDEMVFGDKDEEEVTAEFSLSDKIRIIRNRIKNDEA